MDLGRTPVSTFVSVTCLPERMYYAGTFSIDNLGVPPMEYERSETGWSYLPPQAGRPALWFQWSIRCRADGPGSALLWLGGPEPELVEVAGPCHLMAAMLEKAQARQVSDEMG